MADENTNERDDERDDEASEEGSQGGAASGSTGASSEGESEARVGDLSPEEQDRIAAREAEEIRREEERLAQAAEEPGIITGLMGIERWVQFAFIALGGLVIFVGDRLIEGIWTYFAEPDPTIVSGSAALLGIVVAFLAYRHPRTNELAHEVVEELAKVTWPTRDETYYSTLVVIVTSVIAALYTGLFDAAWSAFTDLIYNV